MTGALLAGKTILVVEDTLENMRLFRAILKLEGAEVLEAERARRGLELAASGAPDAILMDLQMPDMDGLTAVRSLKSDPATQAIPVIVVTAFAMEQERRNSFAAGCDAFVTKPIDPANLVKQILEFVGPHSASQARPISDQDSIRGA